MKGEHFRGREVRGYEWDFENFRFGWTSFSFDFRGYGVLGDMMGGYVSFLLCDDFFVKAFAENLLKLPCLDELNIPILF